MNPADSGRGEENEAAGIPYGPCSFPITTGCVVALSMPGSLNPHAYTKWGKTSSLNDRVWIRDLLNVL